MSRRKERSRDRFRSIKIDGVDFFPIPIQDILSANTHKMHMFEMLLYFVPLTGTVIMRPYTILTNSDIKSPNLSATDNGLKNW
jgi:hypothetical protein